MRMWYIDEEVYLKDYSDMRDVKAGLSSYFEFYNNERIHQALCFHNSLYWMHLQGKLRRLYTLKTIDFVLKERYTSEHF